MSCMTTFGHSFRPTMSKSWTFVLDLKVKVFDTSAAYNKFLGTIFLFLVALALLGKLIPGKGFQYLRVIFVFGVKVDAVCYHLLESGKMKSKSLINSLLGAKKCCLSRSLWDLTNHCVYEYETPHLTNMQLSGFGIYPWGWAQRLG